MKPKELSKIINDTLRPYKWFNAVGITGEDETDKLVIYVVVKPKGNAAKPLEEIIAKYPENIIEVYTTGKMAPLGKVE